MDTGKVLLTSGVVSRVLNQNEGIEDMIKDEEVIVQVLGTKVMSVEDKKYRLCISDGTHRTSTVLFQPRSSSDLSSPPDNSVIDVGGQRSYLQRIKGRTAWFINSYKLLSSNIEVIGDPVTLSQTCSTTTTTTPGPSNSHPKRPASLPETPTKKPHLDIENGEGAAKRKLIFNSSPSLSTHEIKSLNPYTNKYKILCRVISKGTLRKWSNSRGEGQVFNVTLQDCSGEIQASAFNQVAEKLFPIFVEGKAFLVSGAQIKPVKDRRYNSTNHHYEMGLTEHSLVIPVEDSSPHSSKLPQLKLSITKLSDISDRSANDLVDVLGIVVNLGNAEEISVSKGARTAIKRELSLRDNSGSSVGGTVVSVTLWEDKSKLADHPVEVNQTVMVIRNAKISDWKGKSLNVGSGSTMLFNPNMDQAKDLNLWWNSFEQSGQNINSLSQESNKSHGSYDQYACLGDIQQEFKNNVADGRTEYYVLGNVYISEIKKDKMMFKACENCSKKISEPSQPNHEDNEDSGSRVYVCKSCNTHSKHFSWRYVLNVGLADFTGHHWATVFDPMANTMLGGLSAKELNDIMENDFKKFEEIMKSSKFNRWRLKVKAKVETWQKETRLKLIAVECECVNQTRENERLQKEIDSQPSLY